MQVRIWPLFLFLCTILNWSSYRECWLEVAILPIFYIPYVLHHHIRWQVVHWWPNISQYEDEEVIPIPHAFCSASEDSTVAVPVTIKTVWEAKTLEKLWTGRVARWEWHFCGVKQTEWNHTKAWHHAIGWRNFASCQSSLPKWGEYLLGLLHKANKEGRNEKTW